jgi:hypothetical protein
MITLMIVVLSSCGFSQNKNINQLNSVGRKHGVWVFYHPPKHPGDTINKLKLEEGKYVDGKKEGYWIKYLSDGKTPRVRGEYHHSRPNGDFIVYDESGRPAESGHFFKNNFDGNYKTYHPNGQVALHNPCGKDNVECDTIYYYRDNGCLVRKAYLKKGYGDYHSVVYSKTDCNIILDTVDNYEGWASLYEWEADTMEHVQLYRLSYPLSNEVIKRAFLDIKTKKLDVSAGSFWKVVAAGKNAIPFLLDLVDDQTKSTVLNTCGNEKLKVGELAYIALLEIADFPEDLFFTSNKKSMLNACGSYNESFIDANTTRPFKKALFEYYEKNEVNFELVPLAETDQYRSYKKKYGIRGKYVLTKTSL